MATLVTSLILSVKIHNWTSLNFSSIHAPASFYTDQPVQFIVCKQTQQEAMILNVATLSIWIES